jgi:hypothetical protein
MTSINPKTEQIAIDYPTEEPASLRLKIGVGTLNIVPGEDQLVSGEITYNVAEWAPEIVTNDGKVIIKQGEIWPDTWVVDERPKNDWNLRVGTQKPFAFRVSSGAAQSRLTLGGVPLTNFTRISQDAP